MVSFVSRYDTFHVNKERIYRITSDADDLQRNFTLACAPAALSDKLSHEYAGIESVIRINRTFRAEAVYDTKQVPLSGYFADPQFLEVFTFPLIKGNIRTALSQPNSMLITEKAAYKMFRDEDPIGKVITMGDYGDFSITGVLKDHPKNSHMYFEVIAPYEALIAYEKRVNLPITSSWTEFRDNYIYLLLPEGHDPDQVNQFLKRIAKEPYRQSANFKADFQLQALLDIVPGPIIRNEIGQEWDYASLSIFGFLTLLILVPACFNYASISMSRAMKRSKEIGLRKVVGGQRHQIFMQFIMETVMITLLALAGAYFIFLLIRDEFLSMLVSSDGLDLSTDGMTIFYFVLFAVFVGFMAGVVPAAYYSKLNPVQAFKNQLAVKALRGINFRKVLIVGQFALSLGFIMTVVIVASQYRNSLNYNFGFDQENILDVELKTVKPEVFRNEFSRLSTVQHLSMSSNILGTSTAGSEWVQEAGMTDSTEVYQMFVDENYLSNMGLELSAGKNFSFADGDPKKQVIVNEEFLKAFKISSPQDALNKSFQIKGIEGDVMVAGVVRNFHYTSLREPISSFFFRYDPSQFAYANLKVKANDMAGAISNMEQVWRTFNTGDTFSSKFFADEIEEAYDFYFVMIKVCGFLGLLAISVSCLGLLGMVVYTVETRTKEVGVRKVMGATDANVVVLLSKDFLRLMIIAAIIAIPATYLFFDLLFFQALAGAHSFGIGISDIVISLVIMLFLGGATVLSQTIKAARSKPVDTLRYE
jgi:ABC-type antimicrobial peptide transport system permease subunit